MKELQNELRTICSPGRRVYYEEHEDVIFSAPHHFTVKKNNSKQSLFALAEFDFQKGLADEVGINGIVDEDLLAIIACRLEHFQQGPFASNENSLALSCIREALEWMSRRVRARKRVEVGSA
ncbi:MAG: hypothetical protein ACM3QZ_05295 [Solirubrobacterales bacterium]